MSITNTLRKAAKLQEKIDGLRSQLTSVLDQARSEVASISSEEFTGSMPRRGRPKMLKSSAAKASARRGRGRPVLAKKPIGRPKAVVPSKARRSPLAGHKRASSPSGPLAPAVVKVMQSKGKAMSVREILDGLLSSGYKFSSPDPKKNLAARVYRLSGVKQVAPGLFNVA